MSPKKFENKGQIPDGSFNMRDNDVQLVGAGTHFPRETWPGGFVRTTFTNGVNKNDIELLAIKAPEFIPDFGGWQDIVGADDLKLLHQYKGKATHLADPADQQALGRARGRAEKYFERLHDVRFQHDIVRVGDEWWFLNKNAELIRPEYYQVQNQAQFDDLLYHEQVRVLQQQELFGTLEERAASPRYYHDATNRAYAALSPPYAGSAVPPTRLPKGSTIPEHSVINGEAPVYCNRMTVDGKQVFVIAQAVAINPDYAAGMPPRDYYLYDISAVVREEHRINSIEGASGRAAAAQLTSRASQEGKPSHEVSGSHETVYTTEVIRISQASRGIDIHHPSEMPSRNQPGLSPGWSYRTEAGELVSTKEQGKLEQMRNNGDAFSRSLAHVVEGTLDNYAGSKNLMSLVASGPETYAELYEPILPLQEFQGNKHAPHTRLTALDALGAPQRTADKIEEKLGSVTRNFFFFKQETKGMDYGSVLKEVDMDGSIKKAEGGLGTPYVKGLTGEKTDQVKKDHSILHQDKTRRGLEKVTDLDKVIKSTVNFALQVGLMVGGVVGLQQAFTEFSQGHWFAAAGMFAASLAVGFIGFGGVMNKVNAVLTSDTVIGGLATLSKASDAALGSTLASGESAARAFQTAAQDRGASMVPGT